jgi:hypothetical protein
MNYYEKVRDAVERIAECTTSDAQGIIEAWERTNGQSIEEDTFGEAEHAGTTPEDLARTILKMPEREFLTTHYYVQSEIADRVYDTIMGNELSGGRALVDDIHRGEIDNNRDTITLVMDNGEQYTVTVRKVTNP